MPFACSLCPLYVPTIDLQLHFLDALTEDQKTLIVRREASLNVLSSSTAAKRWPLDAASYGNSTDVTRVQHEE